MLSLAYIGICKINKCITYRILFDLSNFNNVIKKFENFHPVFMI